MLVGPRRAGGELNRAELRPTAARCHALLFGRQAVFETSMSHGKWPSLQIWGVLSMGVFVIRALY